jgi:hypothetical protein
MRAGIFKQKCECGCITGMDCGNACHGKRGIGFELQQKTSSIR